MKCPFNKNTMTLGTKLTKTLRRENKNRNYP